MQRFLVSIIAILFVANCASAQVKSEPQNAAVSQEKQRRAEQVVIRAMRRLGQTLEFKVVFREAFIRDETARRNLFKSDLEDENVDLTKIDDETLERIYEATQNWLNWIYFFRADEKGNYLSTSENPDTLIKREVFPKLNNRQRDLYRHMTDTSANGKSTDISQEKILDYIKIYDIAALVIRKNLPRKLRYNLQNKIAVNSKISQNYDESLKPYTNVYDVVAEIRGVWGHFSFTVVEENNLMKVARVIINDGEQ